MRQANKLSKQAGAHIMPRTRIAQNTSDILQQHHVTVTHKTVFITQLRPHPRNYHLHPPSQIAKLRAIYKRVGQFRELVAIAIPDNPKDYWTVAGHGCVEAWSLEGATTVDIAELDKDTPDAVVEAIMVADNLSSDDAEDDNEKLVELLRSQQEAGYDLASVGSDDETLRQLLASLGDNSLENVSFPDGKIEELESQDDHVVATVTVRIDIWPTLQEPLVRLVTQYGGTLDVA